MHDQPITDATSQAVDHLATGIRAIADAASKVAPHAWEIAVRQQVLEGYRDLLAGFLLAWLFAYGARFLVRNRPAMILKKQTKEKSEYPNLYANVKAEDMDVIDLRVLMVVGIGGQILGVILGLFIMTSGFIIIVNPEYSAVKDLVQAAAK